MDVWLDDVFDPVLDDLGDGYRSDHSSRAMAARIKGGGTRPKSTQHSGLSLDDGQWEGRKKDANAQREKAVQEWSSGFLGKECGDVQAKGLAARIKGGGHETAQTQVG